VTVQSPPAYLQAGTYTAISDRIHMVTVPNQRESADAFRALQGFFPDRFPAYSNPSAMNWTIGPGAGIVTNTFVSGGGDYEIANPSNATGSFAASSPTLNRYDILGFQVKDNFYDASGFNLVVPAVIQGANSAGTPVDPTLPSSFIPVVRAVINAGVTSPTLQDLRTRTVPSGAILPIASVTARTAFGAPHSGFQIWRTDRNWIETYDGTAWRVQGRATTTSTADRDSAITNPFTGQEAITTDTRTLWYYTGSAWVKQTVGEIVADTGNLTTTNGATWNSATKVATNLALTFSAINGAKYEVDIHCHGANSAAQSYATVGALIKNGGAPGPTDTQISAASCQIAYNGGVVGLHHKAFFTAAATATYGVTVFGWIDTATGTGSLFCNTTGFLSRLTIRRVE
jgi:hypothetical protein